MKKDTISIIIPVFDESSETLHSTLSELEKSLENCQLSTKLYVIDDGSEEEVTLPVGSKENWHLIRHDKNLGYGAALKTGISASDSEWIGIVDADGSYPISDFSELILSRQNADLIVGARKQESGKNPLLRSFAKNRLNSAASYLANYPIQDLNSGMRVFKKDLAHRYWSLFPSGFSFTSTLTMACILSGRKLKYVPIEYFVRSGESKIRPIKDTALFFSLIFRLGLLFAPSRLFWPVALMLFCLGAAKGFLIDFSNLGYIGNASIMSMLAGIQIFMMSLIAELIVLSREARGSDIEKPSS